MRPAELITYVTGSPGSAYAPSASSSAGSKTIGYVTPCALRKSRAAPLVSPLSTPRTTRPFDRFRRQTDSRSGASCLHGRHHEAKKFSTTVFPRNELSETSPSPVSRGSENAGAGAPTFGGGVWCVNFHTSRDARIPTPIIASACPASLRGPSTASLGRDDEHRRPDPYAVVQPLCGRNLHPDAAVRLRVADRPRLGGAVDSHARRAQPHPARAERVAGAGRNRLGAGRPRILGRRVPPRIPLLDGDLEVAKRRRPRRLSGGDREDAHEPGAVVEVEAVGSTVDHDHRLGLGRGGLELPQRRDNHGARAADD